MTKSKRSFHGSSIVVNHIEIISEDLKVFSTQSEVKNIDKFQNSGDKSVLLYQSFEEIAILIKPDIFHQNHPMHLCSSYKSFHRGNCAFCSLNPDQNIHSFHDSHSIDYKVCKIFFKYISFENFLEEYLKTKKVSIIFTFFQQKFLSE